LTGDLLVQDHWKLYGLPAYVLRLSCIYGSSQSGTIDQGWINHLARQWVNREQIKIFGDGKQVRDILYVTDLTNHMANLIEGEQKTCGIYNIGGGRRDSVSILELLDIFQEFDPWDKPDIVYEDWRVGDQKVYITNTAKAKRYGKFVPSIHKKEGVRRLIARFRLIKDAVRIL